MNYFDLYLSYPDRTIATAWDSQCKDADKTPWLADTLTECGGELFSRFAACYAELSALPRNARRALQRRIARSSKLAAILPEYSQHGDDDYSIGWRGPWPVQHCCWRWGREWQPRRRSLSPQTILASYPMASVR